MGKFRVQGVVTLGVDMLVEAEDAESAIEAAYEKWPGMSNFVGNGKTGGAMIGPPQDETDANIWEGGEPDFNFAKLEETHG